MFAALNTVEPLLFDRILATVLDRAKTWYEHRLHFVEARVRQQLGSLSGRLGDAGWLDGAFSCLA